MNNILGFIRGLSSDVVAFAVIVVAVIAYGLYRGKENLLSLLISMHLAVLAYTSLPFIKNLVLVKGNDTQVFFSKLVVFLAIVFLISLLINRTFRVRFAISVVRNWVEIVALSLASAATLVVISFNYLSLSAAYTSSLLPTQILSSGTALFWTLLGSLVIVFFAAR